jgi:hypothetical protein
MEKAMKTNGNAQAILIDMLQSIQKTNELVVKFALAMENAAAEKPLSVPAAVPLGIPKEIMNIRGRRITAMTCHVGLPGM